MKTSSRAKQDKTKKIHWIWLLLAVFIAKELVWAYVTPPWQAPDELGHYGYIESLAEGELPLLGETKIPKKIELTVNDPTFVRAYEPGEGLNYIAQHPPLYYALLLPFYLCLQQNNPAVALFILRCIGILLGAVTLFFTYKIVQKTLPQKTWLQIAIVSGIAFLPMFSYTIAVLNNDNLVAALSAILIYFLVNQNQEKIEWSLTVGLLFGFAALTKYTALTLVFGIIFVQLLQFFQTKSSTLKKKIFINTVVIFATAFVIAGWWYIRNYIELKSFFPDLKQAVSIHPEILKQYPYLPSFFPEIASTALPNLGFVSFLFKEGFLVEYYKSIWGNFGKFILTNIQYFFIFIVSGLSFLGYAKEGYLKLIAKKKPIEMMGKNPIPHLFFLPMLLSVCAILSMKLFEIAQGRGVLGALNGRYFFSTLVPFFYFFIMGLSHLLPSVWRKYEQYFFGILIVLFIFNDFYTLYNVLIPNIIV